MIEARSSIHSINANTPWTLLVAAFKADVLTYWQVVHWLEFKPSYDRAAALGKLAPQLSGNLLQQGFEALLDVLPRCKHHVSLTAISSFFPFLAECQGPKGLEEVRRAIVDSAH